MFFYFAPRVHQPLLFIFASRLNFKKDEIARRGAAEKLRRKKILQLLYQEHTSSQHKRYSLLQQTFPFAIYTKAILCPTWNDIVQES